MSLRIDDELAICRSCGRWMYSDDQAACDICGAVVHEECGEELPDGRYLCPACHEQEMAGEFD